MREELRKSKFQSSPGPGAGCCQPSARHRPGDPPWVSILTRPGGRVLPFLVAGPVSTSIQVSILTRPGGRVLRGSYHPTRRHSSCRFQSSPGPGAGCCRQRRHGDGSDLEVSILTRPGGRVLPPDDEPCAHCDGFQSSPGPGAGCCHSQRLNGVMLDDVFQSSPGPGAGCCRPQCCGDREPDEPVSILTRPGGRVLRTRPGRWSPRRTGFNPHPARGPGAAAHQEACRAARILFQSSPGPGAGCCVSAAPGGFPTLEAFQSSPGPGGRVLLRCTGICPQPW